MVNEGGGVAAFEATLTEAREQGGGTVRISFSPLRVKHANEVLAWERARLMRIARDTVADDPQSPASQQLLRAAMDLANQLSFNTAGLQSVRHPDGLMRMFWISARGTPQEDTKSAAYLQDFDEFMGLANRSDPETLIEIGEAVLGRSDFLEWDSQAARQSIARAAGNERKPVPGDVAGGGDAPAAG